MKVCFKTCFEVEPDGLYVKAGVRCNGVTANEKIKIDGWFGAVNWSNHMYANLDVKERDGVKVIVGIYNN